MEQPDHNEPKLESDQLLLLGGGDERVEKSEADGLGEANATFLADLNLLIVALSLCSVYNEECLVDSQMKTIEDEGASQGKACMPRLHARKQEPNDAKLMRRQTQRAQTTLRDFRRFRKM